MGGPYLARFRTLPIQGAARFEGATRIDAHDAPK